MKPSFIKDYITVYDDVITPESCDNLVNFFEKNIDESFKNQREHMSFRELALQNFPQYRDETNDLFDSFIEQYKIDNNINDLINKEGFLGLRGLFRLSKSGTVERSFDLKTIKNKKFIVYEKANNFF